LSGTLPASEEAVRFEVDRDGFYGHALIVHLPDGTGQSFGYSDESYGTGFACRRRSTTVNKR
jgi:hypothetical protein